MSLTFAIDFDDTLTACPELWCRFIADAESKGHRVFLVTARRETEENVEIVREFLKDHGLSLPRLFTNLGSKLKEAELRGIKVDIWIDDNPEALVHGH